MAIEWARATPLADISARFMATIQRTRVQPTRLTICLRAKMHYSQSFTSQCSPRRTKRRKKCLRRFSSRHYQSSSMSSSHWPQKPMLMASGFALTIFQSLTSGLATFTRISSTRRSSRSASTNSQNAWTITHNSEPTVSDSPMK